MIPVLLFVKQNHSLTLYASWNKKEYFICEDINLFYLCDLKYGKPSNILH